MVKSTKLRRSGRIARMKGGRRAFEILTIKPTGKRPLEKPRHRWEDNIRMYLKEISVNTKNWVDSAKDRDQWRFFGNVALNHRIS